MRKPEIYAIPLLLIAGCSEPKEVILSHEYRLSGSGGTLLEADRYTLVRNGVTLGQLELDGNRLIFTAFEVNGQVAGNLDVVYDTTGAASSVATIYAQTDTGGKEGHQLIEPNRLGSDLDPAIQTLKGSVIHGGPYEE